MEQLTAARPPRMAVLIASGLGSGYAPVAPGTAGSALGLALGAGLLLTAPALLPLAIAAATLAGLWAIRSASVEGDPGWIVIDEVAGQWVALLGLRSVTPGGLIAAFALFRLLDVVKPGPVGWADRQKGAAGIMADDLVAGTISACILWAIGMRWPNLL